MEIRTHSALPNFADLLLDAVFVVDAGGRIIDVSAASEAIFGYTPEEMIGRSMIDFVAPEDRARTMEEAKHVMAGHPRVGFENRYMRKDGRQVHIMWSARWSEADQLRIGVARDVTEKKRAEEMQAATWAISEAAHKTTDLTGLFAEIHHIIAKLVPVAGFAVATCDLETGNLAFPYQKNLHGKSPIAEKELAHQYCSEAIRSGQPALRTGTQAGTDDSGSYLAMPLVTHKETIGALLLKSHRGTVYADKDKELLQFVSAQVATAMERRQLHAELMHAARYDELTGLPNRRLFHDRMRSALARCRRNKTRMAILYVDIDNFKHVNDSLGHATGDRLLQEFALRMQRSLREADTVARLGGDEFVVLLENVQTPQDADAIADKIQRAVSQPIVIDSQTLLTQTSIGVALYPEDGKEADALLKHADDAMYIGKRAKLNSQPSPPE